MMMMDSTAGCSTVVTQETTSAETSENITVHLRNPQNGNANNKKVAFTEETVDNEDLNRKKSKCCCIFEKQRLFGESSSEDEGDDDCPDHCHGRKRYHKKAHQQHGDKEHKSEDPHPEAS